MEVDVVDASHRRMQPEAALTFSGTTINVFGDPEKPGLYVIRRLFKALGHEVIRLRRIQYGPFAIGDLWPGDWREIPITEARTALYPQPS